ncbi:hypothetical protein HNR65_003092 [Desulfosalsimonas propionicica]|uniref:Uncharacterized protein n=1 Tax=Desulfosalsimonas propionicica TaxID=332175 RepID=A0A7W0HLW1_9BACT|nr:hypothetical protein [Desulfosalsimonas propionicica]MBA2882737.1 hypothetical protein [Desulfosalsimonas propionicica]
MNDKIAGGGIRGLDIAVFAFGGLNDFEMQGHGGFGFAEYPGFFFLHFFGLPDAHGKAVKIFGRFDVVLVGVGPVKLDLFPVVGNGVRRGFFIGFPGIVTPGNKVSAFIIPLEKPVQMIIDFGFRPGRVCCRFPTAAGFAYRIGFFRIRCSVLPGGFNCAFVLGFQCRLLAVIDM